MSETDTKSFRIEYRHMAFFFLGAVCVCAVFFALGFVVGRAQAFETALDTPEETTNTVGSATSTASESSSKEQLPAVTEVSGKMENAKAADSADYRKELDFYSAVKEPKVDQNFHPELPKPERLASEKTSPAELKSQTAAVSTRNGSNRAKVLSLQVAALKSPTEADRLAKALRSKGYPVLIVNPAKDDPSKLIRVQVGPYTSDAEAAKAKARLGSDGYTAITKR